VFIFETLSTLNREF